MRADGTRSTGVPVEVGSLSDLALPPEKKFTSTSGLSAFEALNKYRNTLSNYERKEILRYEKVYFVGRTTQKHKTSSPSDQNGSKRNLPQFPNEKKTNTGEALPVFDDHENFYNVIKHDHIAYRFEVVSLLGKGSFGQVVLALDHMKGKQVALKIIRTESRFAKQAKEEIRILETLRQMRETNKADTDGRDFPIVQLFEHFTFRKHICMTFELLSINLYDLLKLNKFTGLPRDRVRRISFQLLKALYYVEKAGIIHCDLKPENVLLVWSPEKDATYRNTNDHPPDFTVPHDGLQPEDRDCIKLIDFGSSCFKKGPTYPYIQSRFYRAPEVILRLGYSQPIDIWSFGCLVAELINGLPLFPGEDEADQLACIIEILGMPPKEILIKSPQLNKFFIEHRSEKRSSSNVMNFVEQFDTGTCSDVNYLPRYCSIVYPEDGGSPELRPGLSKRSSYLRGTPGSMPLLAAILQPRHKRFKRKDSRSVANLTTIVDMTKTAEEDPVLLKDNELLLSLMLSCLTWSPAERIKPYKAIQHMWLRNFSKKMQAEAHPPGRIHSMEVSRMAPMNFYNGDNFTYEPNRNEPPVPQRRSKITKASLDNLFWRTRLSQADILPDKPDPTSTLKCNYRNGSPARIVNGSYSVNTVDISPTKLSDNLSHSSNGGSRQPQVPVSNHPSLSKRVTLIYPSHCSEKDNGPLNRTVATNRNQEIPFPVVEKENSFTNQIKIGALPIPSAHLRPEFRGMGPTTNKEEATQPGANSTKRYSGIGNADSATGLLTGDFCPTHNDAKPSENKDNEKVQGSPVSSLYATGRRSNSSPQTQHPYRQTPPTFGSFSGDRNRTQPSMNQNSLNSVTTNQVVITKTGDRSSTSSPSKTIQVIRPNYPINPQNVRSLESRLIRINNSRPSFNGTDKNGVLDSNHSHFHAPNRSEVTYEHNSWHAPATSVNHKASPRLPEQKAPEVAAKPGKDVLFVNSGRHIRTDNHISGTSVWAPQPYYQQSKPSNGVVIRRISGSSYPRRSTIEFQPFTNFQEY
ncbi:Dual specificity tyrosine-phosphorylation-regulated kinase 2 [Clonorchis sinensis]|uniref:dual-specificity kinase n=1 Tax=Clonorchis sinensis TaxID=79923 RepID=A0A8T1M871_CLOSI|nr:Dual specificity tyrosine-phosphorylation-regulated kinase 2 [Clonorchis sinensis]